MMVEVNYEHYQIWSMNEKKYIYIKVKKSYKEEFQMEYQQFPLTLRSTQCYSHSPRFLNNFLGTIRKEVQYRVTAVNGDERNIIAVVETTDKYIT